MFATARGADSMLCCSACHPFAALGTFVRDELNRASHLRRAFKRSGITGLTFLSLLREFEAEHRLCACHGTSDLVLAHRAVVSSSDFITLLFTDEGRFAVP